MYGTILFPTDGSERATAAAEHAVDLAARLGATLHVLYVADVRMAPVTEEIEPDEVVELHGEDPTEEAAQLATAAGLECVQVVRVGVPHEVITEYTAEEGVDLVVMGTHGRTGLSRALLGSTTERVLRTSAVPVLAVPRE